MNNNKTVLRFPLSILLSLILTAFFSTLAVAASPNSKNVINYWTPERVNNAVPRDLVRDHQGRGFMRLQDGSLLPYGQQVKTQMTNQVNSPETKGRPTGNDSQPPVISEMDPSAGAVIGADYTLSARITDASGIKTVSFVVVYPSGQTQSFTPASAGNDVWQIPLSGFSDGNWQWYVVAKDTAGKGGNTATSATVSFTVDSSSSGGDSGGGTVPAHVVVDASWQGGNVQSAAGRILFEMPNNSRLKRWTAYVCSGTVVTDNTLGRSVILTAAHCVYDDGAKAFARNVLFIPDQASTTGTATDSTCSNDPLGCWVPSFGVVDTNWTTRTFPANVAWDYAYYVVADGDYQQGFNGVSPSGGKLDVDTSALVINFNQPYFNDGDASEFSPDYSFGMGYSYSQDPMFRYCAEDMVSLDNANWWLANCGLSGGASGGPWLQSSAHDGNGPIISVNSWGYTTEPGMAGPKLVGTSAECLYTQAQTVGFSSVASADGQAGLVVSSSTSCP